MPTVSEAGLGARLSPHFGSAPWFTVVDSETGEATAIPNARASHEHGCCTPVRELEGQEIGVVICRGLGRRALENLRSQGMDVLVTEEWTVASVLESYRSGALEPMALAAACAGGHHDHDHGHGHGHEHGHEHAH